MDAETLEKYKKAGRIAAEALAFGKNLIKPGTPLLEVVEKTEEKIAQLGGNLAFPVQIALNDIAAHFCPDIDDKIILNDQIASIDIGVHIDGFIGDNACTVDLSGKRTELIKASEEALQEAIKVVRAGVTLGKIGAAIHDAITKYGFSPVINLSGHGVDKFNIHSKPNIPNFNTKNKTQLEEDMVIAIEPFASSGAGIIYESGSGSVFTLVEKKPVRDPITRQVLAEIEKYENLPFARRWLQKKFTPAKANFGLLQLKKIGALHEYPPLVDKNHGLVSQAEHTVLVKDKAIILTKAE